MTDCTENTPTDIAITGGGIVGGTLALALAQQGMTVTLLDAQPRADLLADDFDGRAYALALTSVRMLDALGLWDRLAPDAQPMLEIKVSDGRAGHGPSPFFMHFDHGEIEEGPMGHLVEDRHMRAALFDALEQDPRITVQNDARVLAQTTRSDDILLSLANGASVNARLLIGADGRGSGTATRAGIKRMEWDYNQSALVCALSHTHPHDGIAHQFFMPSGPLAILPLTGNRCSIVWTERQGEARRIAALDDAGYLDVLRPRFGSFLGDISLAGARFTYPLGLSLARDLIAPRVVLVGDAAHGVHPIAGQGLNAGMRDIAALAEVLSRARRRGEDIAAVPVLTRYRQWRRFDTAALALATDSFNRLFSNDNALLRAGRGLGMGLIGSLPRLRRGFIREAAGLTGEVPALMDGRPI